MVLVELDGVEAISVGVAVSDVASEIEGRLSMGPRMGASYVMRGTTALVLHGQLQYL